MLEFIDTYLAKQRLKHLAGLEAFKSNFSNHLGCPSLDVAQPDPSIKMDYDVLMRFTSS
jgi:hypothetical protein